MATHRRAGLPRKDPMSHIPVNHPLRPLYRVLSALTALYVIAFGLVGTIQTVGDPLFDRSGTSVLGLRTNPAFSLASIVVGALILLAVVVGRGALPVVTLWGGVLFMTVGTAMLALLDTDLNVLNFSMATVIVSFVIGMLLFTAGLYGRSTAAKPA
jgi:hypothetical protein